MAHASARQALEPSGLQVRQRQARVVSCWSHNENLWSNNENHEGARVVTIAHMLAGSANALTDRTETYLTQADWHAHGPCCNPMISHGHTPAYLVSSGGLLGLNRSMKARKRVHKLKLHAVAHRRKWKSLLPRIGLNAAGPHPPQVVHGGLSLYFRCSILQTLCQPFLLSTRVAMGGLQLAIGAIIWRMQAQTTRTASHPFALAFTTDLLATCAVTRQTMLRRATDQ